VIVDVSVVQRGRAALDTFFPEVSECPGAHAKVREPLSLGNGGCLTVS
jgi:hypothetical protein